MRYRRFYLRYLFIFIKLLFEEEQRSSFFCIFQNKICRIYQLKKIIKRPASNGRQNGDIIMKIKEITTEIATELNKKGGFFSLINEKKVYAVSPHIGRSSGVFSLGMNFLNFSLLSEDEVRTIKENFEGMKIHSFPQKEERNLRSIDSSVRMKLKKVGVGNTNFLTKEALEDFLPYWEEKKKEFFILRDSLCENYEENMKNFLHQTEGILQKLTSSPDEVKTLMGQIKSQIPSLGRFQGSFYMNLEFAVEPDLSVFSNESQKTLKEEMEEFASYTIKDMVRNMASEISDTIKNMAERLYERCYVKGYSVSENTHTAIHTLISQSRNKNIFGSAELDQFISELEEIGNELKKGGDITYPLSLMEDLGQEIAEFLSDNN